MKTTNTTHTAYGNPIDPQAADKLRQLSWYFEADCTIDQLNDSDKLAAITRLVTRWNTPAMTQAERVAYVNSAEFHSKVAAALTPNNKGDSK